MTKKNKHFIRSHLLEDKLREIIKLFSAYITNYEFHKRQAIFIAYPLAHLDQEKEIKKRVLAESQKNSNHSCS